MSSIHRIKGDNSGEAARDVTGDATERRLSKNSAGQYYTRISARDKEFVQERANFLKPPEYIEIVVLMK